jgi:phosphatidylglycerophosphatase A
MITSPPRWITVFGLGSMRPAPGTWGSLPPVVAAAALIVLGHGPQQSPWLFHGVQLALLVIFSLACLFEGDRAEAHYGEKDPSNAVADETAGQTLSLFFLPASACRDLPHAAATLALAFVAFRIMDIIKPWPAKQLQRVPGGMGILIDDLFAGLYAAAIVQVVTRLWLV